MELLSFAGVIVNCIAVIVGSILGVLFRSRVSKKITEALTFAVGLCAIYIGIDGMADGKKTLVLIVSMVVGTLVGTLLDIDGFLTRLSDRLGREIREEDGPTSYSHAFLSASLLCCVGSMTIVGGLEAGISGDNTIYYTKAVLDLVTAMILGSSMGIGVIFSAATVLVLQGGIVALAYVIEPILEQGMILEINCVGSLIILALGLNFIGLTKFKVANFSPAILLAPLFYVLFTAIGL